MRLIEYLDKHHITYREFAKLLGIKLHSLQSIAYGKRRPSLEIAIKIEELTKGEVAPREILADFHAKEKQPRKRKSMRKRLLDNENALN